MYPRDTPTKTIFILFKCGLSDISLCKYYLIKCNFLTVPERKVLVLKIFLAQNKRFENGFEKKFPDLNFFPDFGPKPHFSLTGKSLQNFP